MGYVSSSTQKGETEILDEFLRGKKIVLTKRQRENTLHRSLDENGVEVYQIDMIMCEDFTDDIKKVI